MLRRILDRLLNEPILVIAFVTALIDAAVAFGAPITEQEKVAVITVVTTGMAILARALVTPV